MKLEPPTRPFADSVASIDVRHLYRLGLFVEACERVVPRNVDSAVAPEIDVRVVWDPDFSRVTLSVPGQAAATGQRVTVGRRANPRGGGYYFECPVSGERCEKLYFFQGRWAGRRAQGLSYSAQAGSLADRHRHSIRRLTALLEGPRGPKTAEARAEVEARIAVLERKVAELPRRGAGRATPEARDYASLTAAARSDLGGAELGGRALGCEAALARGRALGDVEDAIGWLFHRADHLRSKADVAPAGVAEAVRTLRPGFCEDHARISLRVLREHGLLKPGRRRGATLDWTGLGCGLDRCTIMLDLREEGDWYAVLEVARGREVAEQALRIVVGDDGEPAFLCPLARRRSDTIAYRSGAFAAPEALRLTRRHGRA